MMCDLHERHPGYLKIALTTNDLTQVDADFMSARQFVFYGVNADKAEFLDCIQFKDRPRGSGDTAGDGAGDAAGDAAGQSRAGDAAGQAGAGEQKKGGGRCCGNAPAPAVGSSIDARIEALAGSSVLFTLAMSDPQSVRVADLGVFPVKLAGARSIYEVLDRLQEMLKGTPPLWLQRALRPEPAAMEA